MNNKDDLKSLSDDELLRCLSEVLAQSRRVEWVIVAHIAEVDARRLYASEGSPSMFQYCLDALHLSESEAYRRIAATRLSRRYPVLLKMLEDGRIHLAGIAVLKKHLTDANYEDVLDRATHKTKRELEQLVAELAPKPDVAPTIRKRPQRKAESEPLKLSSSSQLCPGTVEPKAPAAKPEPAPDKVDKPATVKPLSLRATKWRSRRARSSATNSSGSKALIPGGDLASIIDAAVSEKLERLEAKRYGKTNKPRKNLEDADTSPGVRGISAAVKRAVWKRDRGQCTFIGAQGKRCPERHRLELHHDEPYGLGLGGDRSVDNVRLACPAHNAYMAELDYGKEKMDRHRRSAERVGEPQPTLELGRDKVA